MFLEWISELGFLSQDKESFPLPTRSIIAAQIADYLLKDSTPSNSLTTPAHVNLVMECVGQGFSLPIDVNGNIIRSSIELYKRWLLDPKGRPPPVEADDPVEQRFIRRIFRHYSMLFAPRTEKDTSIEIHYELCSTVLEIFESVGRQMKMSPETWEELLRIILGICDCLLQPPGARTRSGTGPINPTATESPLSVKLGPQLLRVLFELWLRSATKNNSLWLKFGELFQQWRGRIASIQQWSVCTTALSNRLVRILYGNNEGSDAIQLFVDGKMGPLIMLSDDYVFYSWYRFLYLIGDLESIPNATNYTGYYPINTTNHSESLKGVNKTLQVFLNVSSSSAKVPVPQTTSPSPSSKPKPPEGNTLLNIFGPWLFKAIIVKKKEGYDRGIAEAISALCNLFLSRYSQTYSTSYLASFYRALEDCLTRNNYLMEIVLTNCKNFFQYELKGSRILLPTFVHCIKTVLSTPKGSSLPGIQHGMSNLRNSCISILSSIFSLSVYYDKLSFSVHRKEGHVHSYSDIMNLLDTDLLLEALRSEENSANLQHLFWMCTSYIYQQCCVLTSQANSAEKETQFGYLFITQLLHQILSPGWTTDIINAALHVLQELASLYPLFKMDKNKEISAFLLSTICKFIEFEFTITSNKTTLTEDLITNAFYVIGDWVMADQKILKSKDLLKKIFRVLEIGMGRVHSKDNQNSSGSGSASGGSNSGNNGGSSGNVSTNSSNNANANSGTQNNANINVHSSINSQSPNISQSSINTPTVQANSSANNASNSSTSITASGSSGNLSNITVIHQDRNLFNATHRIRESAEYVYHTIMNQIDTFPGPLGVAQLSSVATEEDILFTLQVKPKNVAVYLFDKTIITAIKHPATAHGSSSTNSSQTLNTKDSKPVTITIILRDLTGKYTWNMSLNYPPPVPVEENSSANSSSSTNIFSPSDKLQLDLNEDDKRFFGHLTDLLEPAERRRQEQVLQKSIDRVIKETTFLKNKNYGLNFNITVPRPLRSTGDIASGSDNFFSLTSSRLLLTHFGFTQLSNHNRFSLVQPFDAVQPFDFLNNFKIIDQSRERETYCVGCVYVPKRSSPSAVITEDLVFEETTGSRIYWEFVSSLGSHVHLPSHLGFKGNLDPKVHGEMAIYHSAYDHETVFHVSTLIPNQSSLDHKKNLFYKDTVLISYVEDLENYSVKLFKWDVIYNIVIHPLPFSSGLFRIKIIKSPKASHMITGPLVDECLVSAKMLPLLVRQTAINACRSVSGDKSKPLMLRKSLIQDFIHNYKVDETLHNFYGSLFVQ